LPIFSSVSSLPKTGFISHRFNSAPYDSPQHCCRGFACCHRFGSCRSCLQPIIGL
jgi:hypothetical protein